MTFIQDNKKKSDMDPKSTEPAKNKTPDIMGREFDGNRCMSTQGPDKERKVESKFSDATSENLKLLDIKPGLAVCAKNEGQDTMSPARQVGTVDHMEGEAFIKLNKNDSADGCHHWIPKEWVERVDAKSVYLNKTKEEFQSKRLNKLPVGNAERKAS